MGSNILLSLSNHLERVHYFSRQLITAEDMTVEQNYFLTKLRKHNLNLHGSGIVRGCEVKISQISPLKILLTKGYLITPQGDEIEISDQTLDIGLNNRWSSDRCFNGCSNSDFCPPSNIWTQNCNQPYAYLAIRYIECNTNPVKVHPSGCGCDENACDYSRIKEGSELALLIQVPDIPDNPWVILAKIDFTNNKAIYEERNILKNIYRLPEIPM